MAIDTEQKRRSAWKHRRFGFIGPVGTGIDADDRALFSGFYSGITYSDVVASTFNGGPLHSPPRPSFDDPSYSPLNRRDDC